jgi:hypothetical protein
MEERKMKNNAIRVTVLALLVLFAARNNASALPGDGAVLGGDAYGRNAVRNSSGTATVLLLPAVGGSHDENLTLGNLIANLRDINKVCNLIDESQNTALLPAGFTGFTPEDNELLYRLGCQYQAQFIVYANIQKFGQRNLAIVSRYSVYSQFTNSSRYVEYSDPVEAWIKLPGVISELMKIGIATGFLREISVFGFDVFAMQLEAATQGAAPVNLQIKYGNGVDRVFAARMISLLAGDFSVVEESREKEHSYATVSIDHNRTLVDRTADIEAGRRNPKTLMLYIPRVTIEVSRQGNKTRFKLTTEKVTTSVDVTDVRDFIRQMRGLSLTLSREQVTAGYDLGIEQGVKYNYWKYSGEDSSIADFYTYVAKIPPLPAQLVEVIVSKYALPPHNDPPNIQILIPVSAVLDYCKIYCSTENDFSKALLLEADKDEQKPYLQNNVNIRDNRYYYTVFNVKPDTQYYFWIVNAAGFLTWIESDPTGPFEARTYK